MVSSANTTRRADSWLIIACRSTFASSSPPESPLARVDFRLRILRGPRSGSRSRVVDCSGCVDVEEAAGCAPQ